MPSSTETYLRDSFTARKPGLGAGGFGGRLKRRGGPTTTPAGVHLTPTCAYHTRAHQNKTQAPRNEGKQNSIFDSSADNRIDFAVAALSP